MEVTQLPLTIALAAILVLVLMVHRRRNTTTTSRPKPAIMVADPDLTRRLIFNHADAFSNHPLLPFDIDLDAGHPKTVSITSAPYGPFWRALRRNLAVSILLPRRVAELQLPLQRHAVDALVAHLSSANAVVVVRDALYAAVFATAARLCFGDDVGDRHDVGSMQKLLHGFFHSEVSPSALLASRWARLVHRGKWRQFVSLRSRLGSAFGPVIAARRLSRGSNNGGVRSYLDSLLDVRVPVNFDDTGPAGRRRGLRDDEIVKLVWEFLGVNTESVVSSVEWTLARLVSKPEVQEKLHLELTAGGDHRNGEVVSDQRLRDTPYLRAVILESLRLHPPQPMLMREVGPDGAATAGVPIPSNGTVARLKFSAEVIGRDPKAWSDPEEFRPERFIAGGEAEDVGLFPRPKEMKMAPFGAGRRHCPGAELSMVHVGGIVAALVGEFEWAPPADGSGVDLTATTALFVKVMASPLRARITRRVPQL
ncbi:hypothetical protein HU200_038207 [Digitaria exilis]|uniref:Cytochrome P450 n=1 Tax=Digitaria exilis TaxID=1010633 RepID=A0A835BD84_9POAL|nr:hypothetical protein HU200_038207 [Digitaria exilis]